jgi:hypothetical protein
MNTDLKLGAQAGLGRPMPAAGEGGYTFATFQEFGWTRTLSEDWIDSLP